MQARLDLIILGLHRMEKEVMVFHHRFPDLPLLMVEVVEVVQQVEQVEQVGVVLEV